MNVPVVVADRGRIPGPRGWEKWRLVSELRHRPFDRLLQLALEYGDIVMLDYPGERVVLLSNPDYIEHILACRPTPTRALTIVTSLAGRRETLHGLRAHRELAALVRKHKEVAEFPCAVQLGPKLGSVPKADEGGIRISRRPWSAPVRTACGLP